MSTGRMEKMNNFGDRSNLRDKLQWAMYVRDINETTQILENKSKYATKSELCNLNSFLFNAIKQEPIRRQPSYKEAATAIREWQPIAGLGLDEELKRQMFDIENTYDVVCNKEGDTSIYRVYTNDLSLNNWKRYTNLCISYEDMHPGFDCEVILFDIADYNKIEKCD